VHRARHHLDLLTWARSRLWFFGVKASGPGSRGAAGLCYLEIACNLGAIPSKVPSSCADNAPALLRS
jgi:hypothetical protein